MVLVIPPSPDKATTTVPVITDVALKTNATEASTPQPVVLPEVNTRTFLLWAARLRTGHLGMAPVVFALQMVSNSIHENGQPVSQSRAQELMSSVLK
jgi:hypothetical protein